MLKDRYHNIYKSKSIKMARGVITKQRYNVCGLFRTEEGGYEFLQGEGVPTVDDIKLLHAELAELGSHGLQRLVHRRVDGVLKTKKVRQTRYYIEKLE